MVGRRHGRKRVKQMQSGCSVVFSSVGTEEESAGWDPPSLVLATTTRVSPTPFRSVPFTPPLPSPPILSLSLLPRLPSPPPRPATGRPLACRPPPPPVGPTALRSSHCWPGRPSTPPLSGVARETNQPTTPPTRERERGREQGGGRLLLLAPRIPGLSRAPGTSGGECGTRAAGDFSRGFSDPPPSDATW
ncbi:hypothetical protein SORBI_3001G284425 [Sorghum bicolor]|uniref:Uncharacterized protein n=1 Tax=Sorghum bicolor TaxID=4558 RepID=A0A1Z5S805_SORBI|nr:hypothetical protein SORBI_3001G284425 [Sorghum bicolor]